MLAMPAAAGAAVDPDSALHAYARARLADGDGALQAAVASYRAAMTLDPDSIAIARRSFAQALESGDEALALRRDFRPRPLAIAGLAAWHYRGGPWEPAMTAMFRG